jgi:Tol biopolymer transport system component
MKRCPECRRDYFDDSLLYCLDDGSALLEGPATADPKESNTAILQDTGGVTAVLPRSDTLSTRRTGRRWWIAVVVVVVLIVASGYFAYQRFGSPVRHFTSTAGLKISKLTNSGKIVDIAISPDGRYVAYVQFADGKKSIRLRQTATASDVEIVPAVDTDLLGLRFTRDGNYLYYINYVQNAGTLYMVPALGGPPTKILFDIDVGPSFSPDGKQLAYIRYNEKAGGSLQIANSDGSGERSLVDYPDSTTSFFGGLAWSPDGKSVVCPVGVAGNGNTTLNLYQFQVADGRRTQFTTDNWNYIYNLDWLADGDVVVCGVLQQSGGGSGTRQLWLVSPGKAPQQITNDLSEFKGASATANGSTIATIQVKRVASVWTLSNGDQKNARQVADISDLATSIVVTPDSRRIVYNARSGSGADIWSMNVDGSDRKQLTKDQGWNEEMSISSDGRYVVFESDRNGGVTHLYRMNVDGTGVKRLADDYVSFPSISSDGKSVIFIDLPPGQQPNVSKVSIDGGEVSRVLQDVNSYRVAASRADDKIAVEMIGRGEQVIRRDLSIVQLSTGQVLKTMTLPPTIGTFDRVFFAPDGRSLQYVDTRNGSSDIWTIPLEGKKLDPKPLTDFKTERLFSFGWSLDGKMLVVSRGEDIEDAVLISDDK